MTFELSCFSHKKNTSIQVLYRVMTGDGKIVSGPENNCYGGYKEVSSKGSLCMRVARFHHSRSHKTKSATNVSRRPVGKTR